MNKIDQSYVGLVIAALWFGTYLLKFWIAKRDLANASSNIGGQLSAPNESEKKVDIHNTKEIVVAGMKSFQMIQVAKADGKIDLADLPLLFQMLPVYQAALADAEQVIPEMKDLSAEEAAELVNAVVAELGGVHEDVKVKIEKVLLALKANYEAVKAFA